MALHGDLSEINLEELVELIGTRSGVLCLGPVQGKTVNIHVTAGLIASFSVEQKVTGRDRIFRLARWFSTHPCNFSFEQKPVYTTQAAEMELSGLFPQRRQTCREDDQRAIPLADPNTVFMLIKAKKVELPLELQRFLDRVAPMLEKGANAHDIARRTRMRVQDVQLGLHGLKQARKAWPAFIGATPPTLRAKMGLFSWLSRFSSMRYV